MLDIGRRDLSRGALASAESTLRHAKATAEHPQVPRDTAIGIDEVLSEVLVQAGRPDDAATITGPLLDSLATVADSLYRRGHAHLRMARAWTLAGRWDDAAHHADLAADQAADADPSTAASVALIRAHIAIGRSRFDQAEQLARSVAEGADAARSPELACEAFEILGQLSRRTSLHDAEQHFLRVVATAEDHGLQVWRTRGLHELSTVDLFHSMRTDRAQQAGADAAALGASSLTALADYHLGSIHCWRGDYPTARSLLRRAEQVARALRLPLLAMILIMQAEVAAQHDDPDVVDRLCAEATTHAPDDPHVTAAAHNARATRQLMVEDHPGALVELEAAANALRHTSLATTSPPPLGRWAVLATLYSHADAMPAVRATPGADIARWNVGHFTYAEAIHLGRTGRTPEAEAAFRRADTAMTHPVPLPHLRHTARRLVAQAAVADGWGDPAAWLHHDTSYFDNAGHPAVARACRSLLRDAGGHLTRKTPGPTIPSHLRGYRITGREMQILQLVTSGMTNTEIANHLVLSRRTVEKHVENLLRKTHTARRSELAQLAPTDLLARSDARKE